MVVSSHRSLSGARARALLLALALCALGTAGGCADAEEATLAQQTQAVAGGEPARIEDHPWQVRLEYDGRFFCGGSVISADWILTAQHCIVYDGVQLERELIRVVAGTARKDTRSGVRHSVAEIVHHPDYLRRNLQNDLTLLRLSTPLPLDGVTIRPIEVMTAELADSGFTDLGTEGTISGFGRLAGGGELPDTLQAGQLEVVAERPTGFTVPDSQIVANGETAHGCNGDSGGPFTVLGPERDPVLAGVASWVWDSCRGMTGFQRVSSYADFIFSVTGAREVANRCEHEICGLREGDCDRDAECSAGLVCAFDTGERYGFAPGTDVCRRPMGHPDFCTSDFPCEPGEGHCDSSAECAPGLFCAANHGPYFGLPSNVSVCMDVQSYCRPERKCSHGYGNCRSNADCAAGTRCVRDVGAQYGYDSYVDVCVSSTQDTPFPGCLFPRSCGVGQGPCTSNVDCKSGLTCKLDRVKRMNTCQGTLWEDTPDLGDF